RGCCHSSRSTAGPATPRSSWSRCASHWTRPSNPNPRPSWGTGRVGESGVRPTRARENASERARSEQFAFTWTVERRGRVTGDHLHLMVFARLRLAARGLAAACHLEQLDHAAADLRRRFEIGERERGAEALEHHGAIAGRLELRDLGLEVADP